MTTTTSPSTQAITRARPWHAVNAAVAWLGLGLQLVLSAGGLYPSTQTVPSQLGYGNAAGLAGAVGRTIDFFSYFTIWSNIVVAVVATLLAIDPARDSRLLRVLRLDALLMITITGIVYAVVLAPISHLTGWQVPANSLLHQITPLLTIVVWLVVGPRGWIAWRTIPEALVLPIVWIVCTLLRGAVIGGYPYPFIDVVKLGYGQVLVNVIAIAVIGVVIAAALLGIDRLLARRTMRA
jgi:hypothetical protein